MARIEVVPEKRGLISNTFTFAVHKTTLNIDCAPRAERSRDRFARTRHLGIGADFAMAYS